MCLRTDLKGVRLEHVGEKKVHKRTKFIYRLNNSTLRAYGNKIVTGLLQYIFHASNGKKSHLQAFRLLSEGKKANLLF